MDLCVAILSRILSHQEVHLHFPEQHESFSDLIASQSYQALCEIRDILSDDSLSDPECFQKIEEIVCVFNHLGSDCGNRHDFG